MAAKSTTTTESKFTFDTLPIPAAKAFGKSNAGTSELYDKLAAVPVGQSFMFRDVAAPDTITDPNERVKSFKELANKARNSFTGAAARFKKADASRADWKFEVRIVDNDELGHGVRVWRTK